MTTATHDKALHWWRGLDETEVRRWRRGYAIELNPKFHPGGMFETVADFGWTVTHGTDEERAAILAHVDKVDAEHYRTGHAAERCESCASYEWARALVLRASKGGA